MSTNEYQEFVIDTFTAMLSMCKVKKYTAEMFCSVANDMKCLINHYASMYKNKDTYENLWQYSKMEYYKPLLMSENAFHILEKNDGCYMSYKTAHKGNMDELLYWEHITPNEIVWKRICLAYKKLLSDIIEENNLRDEIKKCFSNHRLVLLTKSESDKLDKEGGRTGQKITEVREAGADINVAAYRIKLLFDEGIVKYMYLNGEMLSKEKIVDNNGSFIDKGLEYFTKDFFVIE